MVRKGGTNRAEYYAVSGEEGVTRLIETEK